MADKHHILNSWLEVFSPTIMGCLSKDYTTFDFDKWREWCRSSANSGANGVRILPYAPWGHPSGAVPIETLWSPYRLDICPGGVITYTLNVTDDDGSDDQIEVGTVQFCGLQDEANWHTNISEVSTQALESGTLSTTWAVDTATADTLKITLQANSNLTSPVYTLSYTVTFNNAYTMTTY